MKDETKNKLAGVMDLMGSCIAVKFSSGIQLEWMYG